MQAAMEAAAREDRALLRSLPEPLVQMAQEGEAETIAVLAQASQEHSQLVRAQEAEALAPTAKEFGAKGRKALLDAWTGEQSIPDYYAGFALCYQAGLTGKDIAQVRSPYAGSLSDVQRQAAYLAGQWDAAVARGRKAAGRGETTGRELTPTSTAGIIGNGVEQDLADTNSSAEKGLADTNSSAEKGLADTNSSAEKDFADTNSSTNKDSADLHDDGRSEPSVRLEQGVSESYPQKPGTVEHIGTVDFSNKRAVLQQLMQAQTDFAGLDYEMNCTVTSDGKVWRVSGTSGQVSPWGIEALGSSLRGSYSYHNHPPKDTWYSFSAADVQFFFAAGEECAIAADDEYVYVMRRTEDTLDVDPEAVYHRFGEIENSDVFELKRLEKIDPDMDGYHEVMKILSRELKFAYERRKKA